MSEDFVITICALSIPVIIVPSALFFRHMGKQQEYRHKERLRALELGLLPPAEPTLFWPSLAALGIGAVAPMGAFFFAFLGSLLHRHGFADDAWKSACFVGVAGVVCGAVLGGKLLARGQNAPASTLQAPHAVKDDYEPDAYDTVAGRG